MKKISFGAATDVGQERDHNEDNLIACPEQGLWVVADGMGGHAAGEVASAIAIETIPAKLADVGSLPEVVKLAHEAILQAGQSGRGTPGMGCTVVALKVDGFKYEIAWVGDSRAYLWDGGGLTQLTRDHSFVQQLIDAGALSEEEAKVHPQRSVITQALGISGHGEVKVDSVSGRMTKGSQLLLCSDGLTGEVDDSRIAKLLAEKGDETQKVQSLINAANKNGGSDNITVILVSAPDGAPKKASLGKTVPFDAAALNAAIEQKKTSKWSWRNLFKRKKKKGLDPKV